MSLSKSASETLLKDLNEHMITVVNSKYGFEEGDDVEKVLNTGAEAALEVFTRYLRENPPTPARTTVHITPATRSTKKKGNYYSEMYSIVAAIRREIRDKKESTVDLQLPNESKFSYVAPTDLSKMPKGAQTMHPHLVSLKLDDPECISADTLRSLLEALEDKFSTLDEAKRPTAMQLCAVVWNFYITSEILDELKKSGGIEAAKI